MAPTFLLIISFDASFAVYNCLGEDGEDLLDVTTAFYEGQFSFVEMGCQEMVENDSEDTFSSCGPSGEGTEIQLGFQVGGEGLAPTVTVCFDHEESRSLYAYHTVPVEILARDTDGDRPDFKADDYYPFSVATVYEQDEQEDTIADLVGSSSLAGEYIDPDQNVYLARGHLSPNSDFVYKSFQAASFYYVNAAPQWQSFNAGNWLGVEDAVRANVELNGRELLVYTGTNGVLELEDAGGDMVEIYLYPEENRLPVPRYFWKLVIDPENDLAVGLVGVNNVHIDSDDLSDYRACAAIDGHSLLASISDVDSVEEGVVYACEYDDLREAFEEVPDLGDFGILL